MVTPVQDPSESPVPQDTHAHIAVEKPAPAATLVMPGSPERNAQVIDRVGVEGRPADPKAGPAALRLGMLGVFVLVVAAATVLGLTVHPLAGIVAFLLGGMAVFFNPVMGAVAARANEREEVVQHPPHAHPHPHTTRPVDRGV